MGPSPCLNEHHHLLCQPAYDNPAAKPCFGFQTWWTSYISVPVVLSRCSVSCRSADVRAVFSCTCDSARASSFTTATSVGVLCNCNSVGVVPVLCDFSGASFVAAPLVLARRVSCGHSRCSTVLHSS